jgi:long-subunit acyl-CoA synthetase (AMP-forming)
LNLLLLLLLLLLFCRQVWVYGNSFKSVLVAVVVPKEDAIKAWAAANGKSGE